MSQSKGVSSDFSRCLKLAQDKREKEQKFQQWNKLTTVKCSTTECDLTFKVSDNHKGRPFCKECRKKIQGEKEKELKEREALPTKMCSLCQENFKSSSNYNGDSPICSSCRKKRKIEKEMFADTYLLNVKSKKEECTLNITSFQHFPTLSSGPLIIGSPIWV